MLGILAFVLLLSPSGNSDEPEPEIFPAVYNDEPMYPEPPESSNHTGLFAHLDPNTIPEDFVLIYFWEETGLKLQYTMGGITITFGIGVRTIAAWELESMLESLDSSIDWLPISTELSEETSINTN